MLGYGVTTYIVPFTISSAASSPRVKAVENVQASFRSFTFSVLI